MKIIIKQQQISKPTNCWCGDVRPEQGTDDHMNSDFYRNEKSGVRGVPV